MNNFGGGFSPNQVVGGWVEVDDENVSNEINIDEVNEQKKIP